MMRAQILSRPYLLAAFCTLLTFACFIPVSNFQFLNFDDDQYVTQNQFVQAGLSVAGLRAAFFDTSSGHWHPLTWLSHMLDHELFGLNPGPQHLVNALLHAANSGLLFCLLFTATGLPGAAFVAALIFGLHPMRIESVAWISERKDVISMFFGLSALIAYVAYCKSARRSLYLLMLVMYSLSLLAKPTLVSFPFLLLLLDYWPLQRLSRANLREKLAPLAIAFLISAAVLYAQSAGAGLRTLAEMPLSDRLAAALVSYQAYFGKFLIPTGMGIFYPFTSFAPGIGAGALCGLLALTVGSVALAKRHPYLLAGWLWFLVALLPVIGLVQIGGQLFADRWSYLAHIGLIVASVWYVREQSRSRPRTQCVVALLAIVICAVLTRSELPYWRSSESLFTRTLEVSPNNFMAHTNLGSALDASGKLDAAAFHYEEAARLNPTYPEALNNLGTLRARRNQLTEAAALFERALARRPEFKLARYNLGLTYSRQGNQIAALGAWLQVLALAAQDADTLQSIEFALGQLQQQGCSSIVINSTPDERAALAVRMRQLSADAMPTKLSLQLDAIAACLGW